MKNGIPIMLGYFAVSFALGIAAKNVGMDAIQAGYMSITMLASAGEFAALNLIASTAGVIEAILTCLVVNLRYFLMSCSLSQKLDPKMKLRHLFLLAQFVTDELFGTVGNLAAILCLGVAVALVRKELLHVEVNRVIVRSDAEDFVVEVP